ncbi:DNA-binding domain-containing protein, AraC-type [Hoeflea sp. IMCC20628]|uniref:helix-turn-helix transcriptional regulator n=1 Tax=Hoeflea sp. IMCC20628 TaxID=1620421 RepID=UPI00063BEC24|nr:AraC family transcriptional regulator [Hoeflea sp. IMCC20628]AKI02836.1 DNA-binding domain-containing protein, AraC-type [Hoeflea sp. IMCC20628]
MKDFTSTILVNLLQRVVGEVDPDLVSGQQRSDPFAGGIASAEFKRGLVDKVMAKHGPGLLLSVGQYLHLAEETPVATVFRQSADPQVLATKWLRLERYHHASHRTRIEPLEMEGWACHRYSLGSEPILGENCLIAGLLVGLVEMIGVEDCRLQIGESDFAAANLRDAVLLPQESLVQFRVLWSQPRGRQISAEATELAHPDADLARRLAELLGSDVGRSWRIDDAATLLAMSRRSLQRHLADNGRSFSTTLRQARMREATELLTRTAAPLSEIGYCCGYADQSHFQRDFHRVTNITPKRFREMSGAKATGANRVALGRQNWR